MRVLIVPDSFGDTLTAGQAAEAMAAGWSRGAAHDDVTLLPLADGGPGFLEVLQPAVGGELVPVTVHGPLGQEVSAGVLLVPTAGAPVAYLESAHAVGLHLVPSARRDPTRTTSRGLGELLRAALDLGAGRVVVGVGGSATNDAGAGMFAGLGLTAEVLGRGGGALGDVRPEDLDGLAGLRRELTGVDLVAATDVDVPLLGLHGASAGFAAQKGATPQQAQDLERALGAFAHAVGQVLAAAPPPRQALPTVPATGAPVSEARAQESRSWPQLPGAGAGGGLGYGLAVLGARLLAGAQVVSDAVGLVAAVAAADVVLTGEGALDWQSLHGKVVAAVAHHAQRVGVPVVVVAGQVHLGRREWSAAGISGAYALAERPDQVEQATAQPAAALAARVERVARTWSR